MATLTAIKGIRVGHFTHPNGLRGCTVILFPKEGAVAGVDVRGAAPGTRETDVLAPTNLVERMHALLLSGGSAFGLDAAAGVMKRLEEEHIGFDTGNTIRIPIVPAAILYDLKLGDPLIRPDAQWGYQACKNAVSSAVRQGNAGAGAGATVGKIRGMKAAMKGGLGSHALRIPGGFVVAALAAVNAIGNVVDPVTGKILAGVRGLKRGDLLNASSILKEGSSSTIFPGENTTIGIVAVNAPYTKTEMTKIAQMAHDGLARAIRPAHTLYDGDVIFSASVPEPKLKGKPSVTTIGSLAADAFAQAVVEAIKHAQGVPGCPAYRDWTRSRI